ncbi:MAG: hypothetical protein KDI55_07805 [Anaerolineae bacterium]|nr:hypothetical protein [Anaerolineae bacterium]
MKTPILTTKLHIPASPQRLVPRPRLLEKLESELCCKLALICAPAGFGKSTLVSAWVQAAQPRQHVAWLSLDESDNELTRFLTYLVAALRTIEDDIGRGVQGALEASGEENVEAVLTILLNEIAELPSEAILVLDDYHVIEAPPVHQTLAFVLEHAPPQLHLVIATREDPPLPLARLRARGQLAELRGVDLRFTTTEAAEFLNQAMGLGLSDEDVAALESRTEGWITGLQLAAISLQGRKDATSFIKSFTGSHRFVLDYLIEEVLNQQTAEVQAFLLQTAILDRLTGPLCNALTGQNDGQATLEMLEHANLFIVPLDEARHWYRYHHLFAELLRQRLHETRQERASILHQRASEWYEQNGFADASIEHALCSEDFMHAARLIEEQVDVVWQRGEHASLRRWLETLPVDVILSKPHLCIFHAWYLFVSGQQELVDRTLRVAEQALGPPADDASRGARHETSRLTDADRMKIQGRTAAIRAFMDSYRGNEPGIIHHARQALAFLPKTDTTWLSMTAIVWGDAHGFAGDMKAAHEARTEALKVCQEAGDLYFIMLASMKVAITVREQGRLHETLAICSQQVQLARDCGLAQTRLMGLFLAIRGEVLAEFGDLEGAVREAQQGIALITGGIDMSMVGWSHLCLARILFSKGDLAGADAAIRKMENIARQFFVPPWITGQMAAMQARLWLVEGKLEAAAQWARDRQQVVTGTHQPAHDTGYFSLIEQIMLARVLLAQERLDEATRLLQELLATATADDRTTRAIEILNLQALALHAGGETVRAMAALQRSLALAEPQGFMQMYVDEGRQMAILLYETLTRGIAPDYVRRLLAAFSGVEPEESALSESQPPDSMLIEPLSEREIEVLRLVADGLTNQQIAGQLFLSQHTVKVHARNIYGKLGVRNRTQAAARGKVLGILADS